MTYLSKSTFCIQKQSESEVIDYEIIEGRPIEVVRVIQHSIPVFIEPETVFDDEGLDQEHLEHLIKTNQIFKI